jgi:16S rRNA (cytosine967-C5)-methyltransferase
MTVTGRQVAIDVLRRVATQGAFASSALRAAFTEASGLSAPERGLATEIVYGVLRRRGYLDRALKQAAGRPLKDLDPKIHDVLRAGAYQLIYLDRVPAHAIVDTAVELAKKRAGPKASGAVNAILRKLSALPPEARIPAPIPISKDPIRGVAEGAGLPQRIAELLVADLGAETALAFGIASLDSAPLTLRTNRLRTTRDELLAEVGGTAGSLASSVRLPDGRHALPSELPAVASGRASPQDEASMRVVELLAPEPGERILDVCSAPGGKTTDIAERMGDRGAVLAHDRLPERLKRVAENAARLGLSAITTIDVLPDPNDAPFDRVLVDAPCSGLGTLRRHPEIRWRFTPDDLVQLTRTQRAVLAEGASRVRPGGTLVYSVCTVTKAEGEAHLASLAADFEVQDILRTGPHQDGAPDGFFAAKLRRKG